MVALRDHMTGLPWEKPRSSHWIAAAVAIGASLLVHASIVRFFPPVPVGRTGQWAQDDRRVPPLVLRDVRRDPPPTADRPPRFETPDHALAMTRAPDADSLRELIGELLPAPAADLAAPIRGESEPTRVPDGLPERAAWDVRQDILEIRDRIVPDEVARLPRRIIPNIDRVERAPDITGRIDVDMAVGGSRGAEWLQSRALVRPPGTPGLGLIADDPLDEGQEGEPVRTPRLDRSDPLAESQADVTETEAIEQLLQLRISTFRDPSDPSFEYFQVLIERAGEDVLPVLPRDILLIQDASASMTQRTIDQCKEGLRVWLDTMRPEDRFDIIAFREDAIRAFDGLVPATPRYILRARTFIETLRARSGTDVFGSLAPLLDMERDPGRAILAVLISDGIPTVGMVSSTEILQEFSNQNAGQVAVFTVGGGPRVNEYLLDFLSYKNRGDSLITREREQLPHALRQIAKELNRPVLTDLQHQLATGERVDLYPRLLPHLFLDRPLMLYGRKPVEIESMVLRILGRTGEERKDMVFTLLFPEAETGDTHIRREWAWQKVYHLIGEHIQTRNPETLTRIRQLADNYGLDVLYGDDLVPTTFQRRFRFHGQQAE